MWTVGFKSIGALFVTFLLAVGILAADKGKVCKPSANGTVDLCDAEDNFNGVLDQIDLDGNMNSTSVQTKGYVEDLPYTGAPGLGWQELVADGLGGVKPPAVAGTGRMFWVVSQDAGAGTLTVDLG